MNWFHTKSGLALGVLEAGFGFGQMLIVPGSLFFIHYFDWRMTNLALAIFLLVVVFPIVLLLIRNHPDDKGLMPVGGFPKVDTLLSDETKEKNFSIGKALRMKEFWFIVIPFTVCGFTSTGLMDTHLIPYSHNHGFSTAVTSAAVSILAAFNIIGILLSGVISDRWSSRKLLIFLYFSRALSIVLLVYTHNPVLLLIFAGLFGLVDFATVAPTQLLAAQHFKKYSVGFIVGCLFMGHQIGSALGAYVPGLLFSVFGHYEYALYLSIFFLIVAAFLNILLSETFRGDAKNTDSLEVQS
jgi:sugar phosphate permease